MRKLIITRGAPGSGKSTLLETMRLAPFALSMDALRTALGAPVLGRDGEADIDQQQNDRAYAMFRQLADERMKRGELLVLDATFPLASDFAPWLERAHHHRYETVCVDLSSVPMERTREQNSRRPEFRQVSDRVIERAYRRMASSSLAEAPVTAAMTVIPWSEDGSHVQRLQQWLDVPVHDVSHYRAIVHVGDTQGCLTPLVMPGGPFEKGFQDDVLYVFVGDLLDRGLENGPLLRWFVDHALPRDNVKLLWGNHEDHLHFWARGEAPVSREFADNTLPQLKRAGLTREDAEHVVARAQEMLLYTYHGQKVMVTHAGLSTVPARPYEISLRQCAHGTGFWEDPIDAQFERHAPAGWVQVHGHRNHGMKPVIASSNSFNLEDSVEHGGHLRLVTLDRSGWTPAAYKNPLFTPFRERSRMSKQTIVPFWMERPSDVRMSDATWDAMQQHDGVRTTSSQRAPHVSALNFTRDVFFDASWDAVVVKARGLFVNTETREIVARGYDKFFNVGEVPATSYPTLVTETLKFPVTLYVKENGFLGNLGYDAQTDDLFVASKSTPDGDFAGYFREIFESTVAPEQREALRRYLRDVEASMVFEVIDPVRDPHMIAYEAPHLVLLDMFHRSETVERLPYDELKKVGDLFGLKVKERAIEFKNATSLMGWLNKAAEDLSFTYRGKNVEGFVIEDPNGYQTKIKLPFYAFWKIMRSTKDRVVRLREEIETQQATPKPNRQRIENAQAKLAALGGPQAHPLAQAFVNWCRTQPNDVLREDIIQVRTRFENEVTLDPSVLTTPWKHPKEQGGVSVQETQALLAETAGASPAAPRRRGPR